jgi:hypothetical protein
VGISGDGMSKVSDRCHRGWTLLQFQFSSHRDRQELSISSFQY